MLSNNSITFGKYKGSSISQVLRDRSYCKWLLDQEWFITRYEYLYNRVKEYDPSIYFLNKNEEMLDNDFIDNYKYFNLTLPKDLQIELNIVDKTCYEYYLLMIQEIKNKLLERFEDEEEKPYNIKAPTKWLKRFERETGIPRESFKDFLSAYELPNIPYIIERVKAEGGIEYKGAQSFKIAKARSETQEKWWGEMLKEKYGENLGEQFKYEKCIFDFLNISTKTIFECKLGLKDFNEEQHRKYKISLKEYRIIYLISRDCVIEMEKNCIYTNNPDTYMLYLLQIPTMKTPSYLDILIQKFNIVEIENLATLFGDEILLEY